MKQDVETTPLGFTEAAARVWKRGRQSTGGTDAMDDDGAFLRDAFVPYQQL